MSITNKWRGCDNIEFIHYNEWADSDIVWDKYTFNYWDIEDALWQMFCDENGYDDSESDNEKVENEFNLYVQENAEGYLGDVVFGGYFADGSTSWHDNYK